MSIKLRERKGQKRKSGEFAGKEVTVWYLDYNLNGKRWTETLPIKYVPGHKIYGNKKLQLEKVNAIRAQKENEILNKDYDYTPKEIGKINFCDYFENYINQYTKADKRMFIASFNYFKKFLSSKNHKKQMLTIKHIDYEICKGFAEYLRKSNLSGETPYNYFEKFKQVVTSLVKKTYIRNNPISQLSTDEKVKRAKNPDLVKEILYLKELKVLKKAKCPNDEVKDAFLFACFTGLGLAEIKRLDWEMLKDGRIKINRSKTKNAIDFPLSKSALSILKKYEHRKNKVFNLPSSTNGVNKSIAQWVKNAGIEKHITIYCARHGFAVMLLEEAKANIRVVADCMGHSTTVHTIRYLKHIGKSKKKAIKALPTL